ncbi:C1 family peptidase [Pedobacter aquatilis]|uniref:C1 family peptidase n=1 Tax=Pedobacter aquatilis TaxID=351343 RepID=UPI00292FD091|nr:C1 family peptidase [Pedobacter aquatilis]
MKKILFALCFLGLHYCSAQESGAITDTKTLWTSPCEDQGQSSTCWSYSGMSFFQSEVQRIGKFENLNLSEMFVLRNIYPLKADNYVRMHGKAQFSEGGEFSDDLLCLKHFGLMPQESFPTYGASYQPMVNSVDSLVKKTAISETLSPTWKTALSQILDRGLGKPPETFSFQGKTYTPKSFAKALGLDAENYVVLGSFTHQSYYAKNILQVPDNWKWEQFYNIPLDELLKLASTAIEKGFSVAWAADVTGGFQPNQKIQRLTVTNGVEEFVSAESRQSAFDDFHTQDDHAMHLVGLGKDAKGNGYFKVKNSWGPKIATGEFFYVSMPYFSKNTISIMLHKDALPKALKKKLGIAG